MGTLLPETGSLLSTLCEFVFSVYEFAGVNEICALTLELCAARAFRRA